jgi:hypothetical protein
MSGANIRWWSGCGLALLLCLTTVGSADERRDSPFRWNDHWEGYRTWRPERDRRGYRQRMPDQFTIDKPGKCEVRCEYDGRGRYQCREYRC